MLLHKHFDYVTVFMQTRQSNLIYVSKFAFFNQFNEEPKRQGVRAVHQELPDQKVHALHIIGLGVVAGECTQNFTKFAVSSRPNFEIVILWKRPIQISINLQGRLHFGL